MPSRKVRGFTVTNNHRSSSASATRFARVRDAEEDATFEATLSLMDERRLGGMPLELRNVTMFEIAERSGIDRANLSWRFGSVDGILSSWLRRQSQEHVDRLWALFSGHADAGQGLRIAIKAHAMMLSGMYGRRETEISELLPHPARVASANVYLHRTMRGMIARAAKAGAVRTDIAPGELASYALHALGAAANLPAKAAVERVVVLTFAGLRPP